MSEFSRRKFCVLTGASLLAGACGNGDGGHDLGAGDLSMALRDLSMPDLVDPTCAVNGKLHAGPAASFAVGTATFFACARVFVCRDGLGLYAMTSSCTHEGCDVAFAGVTREFGCPCHQSVFDFNGRVLMTPATNPLPHFALSLDGSGNVVVDVGTVVPATTRLNPNGD